MESLEGRQLLSGNPHFNGLYAGSSRPVVQGGTVDLYVSYRSQSSPDFTVIGLPGGEDTSWAQPNDMVRVYASTDQLVGNGDDVLLYTTTYSAIVSPAVVTLPTGLATGTYNLIATCEGAYSYVGRQMTVLPQASGVDLAFAPTGASFAMPSTFPSGEVHAISVYMWNKGGGAALSTSVALYFSPTPGLTGNSILVRKTTTEPIDGYGGGLATLFTGIQDPPLPAGTYYPVVVLDADGAVAETDESNNVLVGSAVTLTTPTVDLAVTGATGPVVIVPAAITDQLATTIDTTSGAPLQTSPYTYIGASVRASATVVSRGDAAPFFIQFILSKNDVLWDGDEVASGGFSGTMTGGGTYSGDVMFIFNDGIPASGSYRLIVQAFTNSGDLTPADNVFLGPMVLIGGADLSLDELSPAADSAVAGGSFAPPTTVRAAGASRDVKVAYVLSKDEILGNADDVPLGTATVQAHGTDLAPYTGTTPAFRIPAGTAPGSYRLLAKVDPKDQIAEVDETNNVLVGPAVTVLAPELRATLAAGPATLLAGKSGHASLRLANPNGSVVSHQYTVRLYLSKDATLSPDDRLFSTRRISASVAPRRTANVALTYALPADAPLGKGYLIAVADVPPSKAAAAKAKGPAAAAGRLTATRVEAFAPVSVAGPRVSAAVRTVKAQGLKTTVTVRISNRGTASFAAVATLRVMLASAPDPTAALLSVRRTFSIRAGKYVDVTVTVPLAPSDASSLVATVG